MEIERYNRHGLEFRVADGCPECKARAEKERRAQFEKEQRSDCVTTKCPDKATCGVTGKCNYY
jgi:hypothetical protein